MIIDKPERIFFTSDLHFNHENIIKFCGRSCKNVKEMNEMIINNWNSVVPDNGITFVLGDIFFGRDVDFLRSLIMKLKGEKHLILGNHDYLSNDDYISCGFLSVQNYLEIGVEKRRIILMHYPIMGWKNVHRGSWMLYGHMHGTYEFMKDERKRLLKFNPYIGSKTMDVGVDTNNLTPWSYYEIKSIMDKR